MTWNEVEHIVKPHIENPGERIANVSISEDDMGIITLVVHFAPVTEGVQKEFEYSEGRI